MNFLLVIESPLQQCLSCSLKHFLYLWIVNNGLVLSYENMKSPGSIHRNWILFCRTNIRPNMSGLIKIQSNLCTCADHSRWLGRLSWVTYVGFGYSHLSIVTGCVILTDITLNACVGSRIRVDEIFRLKLAANKIVSQIHHAIFTMVSNISPFQTILVHIKWHHHDIVTM